MTDPSPVDYIELNLGNYNDDDVSQLNEWGIWAVGVIDRLPKDGHDAPITPGKTAESLRDPDLVECCFHLYPCGCRRLALEAANELDALHAVVDPMRQTEDGVPLTEGMEVWHLIGGRDTSGKDRKVPMVAASGRLRLTGDQFYPEWPFYSTQAAAEAALPRLPQGILGTSESSPRGGWFRPPLAQGTPAAWPAGATDAPRPRDPATWRRW